MDVIEHRNSSSFKVLLLIAGIYHISWGLSVLFFPGFWFRIAGLELPNYTGLWMYIGLMEGIFGIGYLFASSHPVGHWRIVLMGFLTKLLAAAGITWYFIQGDFPKVVFNMVITHDLIWLIPFGIILYNAYIHPYLLDDEIMHLNNLSVDELSELCSTDKGNSLHDLIQQQPVMLIFLRHFGCVFCKETLLTLQKLRKEIEAKGTKIVLVNMLEEEKAKHELAKYNLQDMEYIADPECMLYKGFKLKRGRLWQIAGFKIWWRVIQVGVTKRLFNSSTMGMDSFQMPGIFLVFKGKILKQYVHQTMADIPPYMELATQEK